MGSTDKNYDMTVYPVQVAVRSQSDGAAVHMVTIPYCDCADFTNRKGRLVQAEGIGFTVTVCKHLAEALERVGGWHREPQPAGLDNISRADLRWFLSSAAVQLPSDEITALMRRAREASDGRAVFCASLTGAVVSGEVVANLLNGRWSVKLTGEDPEPVVHADVTRTRARSILHRAGAGDAFAQAALNDAVHGHPCNLPGTSARGPIRVEESGPGTGTRKYTITLYPVSQG